MKRPTLIILIVVMGASLVHAATGYWANVSGGIFAAGANWAPAIPGPGDVAVFTNDGTYTVSFDADTAVSDVQHSNRQGIVTLDIGVGRTWTVTNTYSIGRGSGTTGSVWLTSGTLLLDNASNTARFLVGDAGLGSLVITNGAKLICNTTNRVTIGNTVSSVGKTGNFALVTGSGSTWSNRGTLAIGYTESGSGANYSRLSVEEGALLQAGGLALGSGANGASIGARFWVAGSGTVVAVDGTLNMATPTAQMTITNGAQVADAVGAVQGVGAVVTGPGSLWTNRTYATVGFGANNVSLLVTNGALFYAGGYLTSGGSGGSTVTNDVVTVVGSNAAVMAQRIYVGESHRNSGGSFSGYHGLRVLDGGRVSCATGTVGSATFNLTMLDNDPNSAVNNYAVVSGSGSRWEIGTLLFVGQNGTNNSLTISAGGVVAVAGNVTISPRHPAYAGVTNWDNYISVEGGRLDVTNIAGTANLTVNSSWVAMKGSMGGVTANSLILTNGGRLMFTADAAGFSPIDVSGTMLVGAQSFLTVDMAGYRGLGQIPLIRYGSMPTAFTNANIWLTNGFGRIMQGTDNTIWLWAIRPGTLIMVL